MENFLEVNSACVENVNHAVFMSDLRRSKHANNTEESIAYQELVDRVSGRSPHPVFGAHPRNAAPRRQHKPGLTNLGPI